MEYIKVLGVPAILYSMKTYLDKKNNNNPKFIDIFINEDYPTLYMIYRDGCPACNSLYNTLVLNKNINVKVINASTYYRDLYTLLNKFKSRTEVNLFVPLLYYKHEKNYYPINILNFLLDLNSKTNNN